MKWKPGSNEKGTREGMKQGWEENEKSAREGMKTRWISNEIAMKRPPGRNENAVDK